MTEDMDHAPFQKVRTSYKPRMAKLATRTILSTKRSPNPPAYPVLELSEHVTLFAFLSAPFDTRIGEEKNRIVPRIVPEVSPTPSTFKHLKDRKNRPAILERWLRKVSDDLFFRLHRLILHRLCAAPTRRVRAPCRLRRGTDASPQQRHRATLRGSARYPHPC